MALYKSEIQNGGGQIEIVRLAAQWGTYNGDTFTLNDSLNNYDYFLISSVMTSTEIANTINKWLGAVFRDSFPDSSSTDNYLKYNTGSVTPPSSTTSGDRRFTKIADNKLRYNGSTISNTEFISIFGFKVSS